MPVRYRYVDPAGHMTFAYAFLAYLRDAKMPADPYFRSFCRLCTAYVRRGQATRVLKPVSTPALSNFAACPPAVADAVAEEPNGDMQVRVRTVAQVGEEAFQ
jgi:hypothetical protein